MLQLQFMQPSILSCNNTTRDSDSNPDTVAFLQSETAVGKVGEGNGDSNGSNRNINARWQQKHYKQ